jgi:hypothetical protein
MKYSRASFLASLVAAIISMFMVLNSINDAGKAEAQEGERSLLIERHGNEPLELIDLKIRDQSVKSKIKPKVRMGDDGYDRVSIPNSEEWAKHIRVKLRNISGKPIVGFQAYIYLKASGTDMYFSASLHGSRRLEHTTLDPGEEVEATVDRDSWDRAVNRFWQYGGDINSAEVSLAIGIVAFGDGLQWYKGHTLRVDGGAIDMETSLDIVRRFTAQTIGILVVGPTMCS